MKTKAFARRVRNLRTVLTLCGLLAAVSLETWTVWQCLFNRSASPGAPAAAPTPALSAHAGHLAGLAWF